MWHVSLLGRLDLGNGVVDGVKYDTIEGVESGRSGRRNQAMGSHRSPVERELIASLAPEAWPTEKQAKISHNEYKRSLHRESANQRWIRMGA